MINGSDVLLTMFVGFIIGLVMGVALIQGLNKTFVDPSFTIESVELKDGKCSYSFLPIFSFLADCGKFNVGDIVEFRKVK